MYNKGSGIGSNGLYTKRYGGLVSRFLYTFDYDVFGLLGTDVFGLLAGN